MTRVRAYLVAFGGAGLLVIGLLVGTATASARNTTILEFGTMAPVTGPFVGAANPQRGMNGGGLPWMIDGAQGELQADGHIEVRVEGLVLRDDPAVPAALRGTNPIPNMRVVVSCLQGQGGTVATTNVATDPFPVDTNGNGSVEATLALPQQCVAPEVFVTSPANAWFAVTGR